VDREEVYTVAETAKVLGITNRRVLQLVNAGELEAHREGNRWKVLRKSVHALRDSRRGPSTPSEAPEWPSEAREALEEIKTLQRELGRLEGRLQITEVAESTLREQLEREQGRADKERERADRLEERAEQLRDELEAERGKGFWARLFGG
jgi:excisionase family DNA binding protein